LSDQGRDAAAVRVFPPGVPLLTVLVGIGLDRLWPLDAGFELAAPVRYWIGGLIVAGAVLGLGLWSVVPTGDRLKRACDSAASP
jgi:hypothetical protein